MYDLDKIERQKVGKYLHALDKRGRSSEEWDQPR
jgi:hypothetical protein